MKMPFLLICRGAASAAAEACQILTVCVHLWRRGEGVDVCNAAGNGVGGHTAKQHGTTKLKYCCNLQGARGSQGYSVPQGLPEAAGSQLVKQKGNLQ